MKTAKKVDLRKQFKYLYSPPVNAIQTVDAPLMNFLTVKGSGDTTSAAFQKAIRTLYNLSFTTKFSVKKEEGVDYPVMALEGLWWTSNRTGEFNLQAARKNWNWTLMIMQPDFVTRDRIADSAARISERGRSLEPFQLVAFSEGLAAQIMHIGPYSTEAPTIEKIRSFIRENGFTTNGKHHEIYLGDPRRATPSKLRTILRQPIRKAQG